MTLNSNTNKVMDDADRILLLTPIPGVDVKSAAGMTDPTLFTGENKIHAVREIDSQLWYVKYEKGAPPPSIRNTKFTSFTRLLEHITPYFSKRGLKVERTDDV